MMSSMPCHRILNALFMAFMFHTSVAYPVIAEEYVKGRPVLPDEKCKVTHRNNWNEQERWVWKEVCEGREANLNQREGHQLQPNNPDSWSRSRILRPTFL